MQSRRRVGEGRFSLGQDLYVLSLASEELLILQSIQEGFAIHSAPSFSFCFW